MDLKKAKTYLDKINHLYEGMNDDSAISPIEKKLMLDYISSLYDSFWYETSPAPVEKVSKRKKDKVKATTKRVATPSPAPAPTPAPPPAPKAEPVVAAPIIIEPEPVVEAVVVPPPPPPAPEPVVEEKTKPRKFDFEVPKPRKSASTDFSKAYGELFEQQAGGTKDLSQKIGQRPLANLKRAWGVADKFQVINELFGKNASIFDEAIDALNKMSSMDEARAYIESNLVDAQGWMTEAKIETAKRFIKTVRRRYLQK